jgi:hypothetical protein
MNESEEIQNENDEMEESGKFANEAADAMEVADAMKTEKVPPSEEEIKEAEELLALLRKKQTNSMFHTGTQAHSAKKRGVGITRKDKSSDKKADKRAKKQRAVNSARKNKMRRATGSKRRK